MATTRLERFRLDGIRNTGIEIGRGSYAVVKELSFLGLKCVGKEIHSELYEGADPEAKANMLRRFEVECELLGRLHHPNIVQFLGVYMRANSELPILVMEYLPSTLSSCVDRHGVLTSEISLGILRDVALGQRYLHEHSPPIIHRDLSANNVLLTMNMSAKISDLGVAKILDASPASAARMTHTQAPGTPTYMPPEALIARPRYTSKVDVFSLGVMMVHVLSGEWPMPSEGYAEDPLDPNNLVVVAEFDRRRSSIEKIEDGHPLLGLIRQCLSNIPSRRPDTVEIVRQLREVCSRVPPQPENRLELLQQVQSLRAALQQNSGEENEILRRENETLQADLSTKTQDNNYLRREVQTQQTERRQNRSRIEALQTELSTKTQEIDTLRRESEALQTEARQKDSVISSLGDDIERMRSEVTTERKQMNCEIMSLQAEITSKAQEYARDTDSLRSKNSLLLQQVQSLRDELQSLREEKKTFPLSEVRSEDLAVTSLRDEIARMRYEMASVQNRSRVETESLRTEVQRLTHPSAPPPAVSQQQQVNPFQPVRLKWRLLWRRGNDAPEAFTAGAQAVVMGETVYVDAGHKVYQYHWRRDTWSTLPDCPVKMFGMAQFSGELITVGGKGRLSATGKVHYFNLQANKWEQFLPPMPTARYGLTVATRTTSSSKPAALVACGGHDSQTNKVEVYSHESVQWYTAKPLPIPCFQKTSVTINGTCFILGGSASKNCISASLDSVIDNATKPNRHQSNDQLWSVSVTPLEQSVAASLRGYLIAIGGINLHSSNSTTPFVGPNITAYSVSDIHILIFDGSFTWKRWEENLPAPLCGSVAVCLPSGELLVVGGNSYKGWKRTVYIASII